MCSCMETISVSSCRCCMMYVCVLCVSSGTPQCCVLHDLQPVNAARICKGRPYGRGILQSRSHDYLIDSNE